MTKSNDDIVNQLQVLHKSLCDDDDNDCGQDENGNSVEKESGDHNDAKISQSPLELALNLISNDSSSSALSVLKVVPCLFSTLREIFTATDDTPRKNEKDDTRVTNTTNASTKLKQIQWHVALLLKLWAVVGDGLVSACATLLRDDALLLGQGKKKKRDRKRKHYDSGNSKMYEYSTNKEETQQQQQQAQQQPEKTMLLDHLVETLARAPFLLPMELSLRDFMATKCLFQEHHWNPLPDVVAHLFDAFEIPNPFLETSGEDIDAPLSKVRTHDVEASMLGNNEATKNDSQREGSAMTKVAPTHGKRDKGGPQQHRQQQQKQRLLASVKKNRFLKSSSKSHFHSKLQDISKLLDKGSTQKLTTPITAHSKTNNGVGSISTTEIKRKYSIVTPSQSVGLAGVNGTDRAHGSTQSKRRKKDTLYQKFVTSTNPKNNPPLQTPQRANTYPITKTKSNNNSILANSTSGATSAVGTLPGQITSKDTLVVGETPAFSRSRSMIMESPASKATNNFLEELHESLLDDSKQKPSDASLKISSINNQEPQPVKLFGILKGSKPKSLPTNNKSAFLDNNSTRGPKTLSSGSNMGSKKSIGKSSVQMARAYLRRRSI
jgi:hypothetical protein